ncbi:ABC transporter substrate-binding protein [Streptomyces sp. TS71-3]|uniref:ABC transporter substrate-binding protein n=1 Tax=Streptomyces sp. TS71-3 TaxID=2733862 RepID=UPI001B263F37|nr:ABC transporter substrate-binding protein [Streptomyces sp. TS71-3]GHJ36967.1 hypothetical protein Sm713_25760 [Streptomyces sp. TS71-3]
MGVPADRLTGFPDDFGADVFVSGFQASVAPADRGDLADRSPLLVLRVPGDAAACRAGVHRVVEALRGSIDNDGKLVPYAYLDAVQDDRLLYERHGMAGRRPVPGPEHMTPDRHPNFHVIRQLVAYIREHPESWPGEHVRELRAYVCEQHKAEQLGLLGALPGSPPVLGDVTVRNLLLRLAWALTLGEVPRRLWAWWRSRKVMRGWLAGLKMAGGNRKLFPAMDQIAAVQAARLRVDRLDEQALQTFEDLLTRALLEDLRVPRVGGILPRRRRRTRRPVIIVAVPPPGQEGSRAAERFLRALHKAQEGARQPGPLVVAVGQPTEALLRDLGSPAESDLAQAAHRLSHRDGAPVVLVPLSANAMERPGLPVPPVPRKGHGLSWRTEAWLEVSVVVLALIGASLYTVPKPVDTRCVGGSDSVAESAQATPTRVLPKTWYDSAREAVDTENRRVEDLAAKRTVRTVVAFGSNSPRSETDALFDGTIPELRGIALWQMRQNQEADSDDSQVLLRVDVRPTGTGFKDAVPEAEKLVQRVRGENAPGKKEYEKVVGVLGYAQSRGETKAALDVLARAGIPAIGTTATADELLEGQAHQTYWPLTPTNSREAAIEADFARKENIVARPGTQDSCSPARRAIVIENAEDLYSRSLAAKFIEKFTGPRPQVFDYNQDDVFGHTPSGAVPLSDAGELSDQVCRVLKAEPDSVVYWSARARDFSAFINAVDRQGTCTSDDITVLGGNELTNVSMTGVYSNKSWLRLYYSMHRLPAGDRRASERTRQFVAMYEAFVRKTTRGEDPWAQDGHSAVAYDAFHVLSEAVDQAGHVDKAISRSSVLLTLGAGITFDGATGLVSYKKGVNGAPQDKTLVLVRQLADEPEVVAVCGAYGPDVPSRTQGVPCGG